MASSLSEKVKMVDIHPKEPIFIAACYSGVVNLWNYNTQTIIKSFDSGKGSPTRCARFLPKLESFVCGSDDKHIRVFNYHTMERTHIFRAHDDFIRSIAVHEQLPIVITCADDGTIRQWDWSDNWSLKCTYEGHSSYCMDLCFNPSNNSTFATASLDTTISVWTVNNPEANFDLLGHEDGVTCLHYYPRGDKPYLLSGSDDLTARLWDYQTKACLHVFSFADNTCITSVLFSPDQPVLYILPQSGSMKTVSMDTFEVVNTNFITCSYPGGWGGIGLSQGWSLATKPRTNVVIAGFDAGVGIFKLGESKPVFSMEANGKLVIVDGNELMRVDIKGNLSEYADGETIPLPAREMGSIEARAESLFYNKNGQLLSAVTRSDFTIISSLSLRQKAYGRCLAFAWGPDTNSYATLEDRNTISFFQSFQKKRSFPLPQSATNIFSGSLLVVCGTSATFFFDWDTCTLIRQIDEVCSKVQWSASGELLSIVTSNSIFVLRYERAEVEKFFADYGAESVPQDGLDFAFDLIDELDVIASDVLWIGDCMVYLNEKHRLSYYIGGEASFLTILRPDQYIIGYQAKVNRIFCLDKDRNISSYQLEYSVVAYMTAIVRENFEEAEALINDVSPSSRSTVGRFLQSRGLLELALAVTSDEEQRFALAVELKQLTLAKELAGRCGADTSASKWKLVADLALESGDVGLSLESYRMSGELNSVLLILSSLRDMDGISKLGEEALREGQPLLSFNCFHLAGRYDEAAQLLCSFERFAEAAFYARVYAPAQIEMAVNSWKNSTVVNPRVRESIANPSAYPNLFPMFAPAQEERKEVAANGVPPTEDDQEQEEVESPHPAAQGEEEFEEGVNSDPPVEEEVNSESDEALLDEN